MTMMYSRYELDAMMHSNLKQIEGSEPITVIVCGGRDYADKDALFKALDDIHAKRPIGLLVHGGARGADRMAGEWAFDRGVFAIEEYPDWTSHGKAAGPMRNAKMLIDFKPNLVIAFPGGKGTADMINKALMARVPVVKPMED